MATHIVPSTFFGSCHHTGLLLERCLVGKTRCSLAILVLILTPVSGLVCNQLGVEGQGGGCLMESHSQTTAKIRKAECCVLIISQNISKDRPLLEVLQHISELIGLRYNFQKLTLQIWTPNAYFNIEEQLNC